MTASLRKEFRQLSAVWISIALLAVVAASFGPSGPLAAGWVLVAIIAPCFIATSMFGKEIETGTLSLLLAQPVSRARHWREKLVVAGLALGSVALILSLGAALNDSSGYGVSMVGPVQISWLAAWCFLGSGMFFTLWLRHPSGAFWMTLLFPGLLLVLAGSAWKWIFRTDFTDGGGLVLLLAYGAAGFVLARWQLFRGQDKDPAIGRNSIAIAYTEIKSGHGSRRGRLSQRTFRALILKELGLQQINICILFVLALAFAMALWVRSGSHSNLVSVAVDFFRYSWLILPFTIGAVSIAEERCARTHGWQKGLPISRGHQWGAKVFVCYVLSFLVGLASFIVDVRLEMPVWIRESWDWVIFLILWHFVGTTIGLHASSLARSFTHATSLILMIVVCLAALIWFGSLLLAPWVRVHPAPLLILVTLLFTMPVQYGLARINFDHDSCGPGLTRFNITRLIPVFLMAIITTWLTQNRTWELYTLAELTAGPRQVAPGIRPQIIVSHRISGVGPDGIPWTAFRTWPEGSTRFGHSEYHLSPNPLADNTNWLAVSSWQGRYQYGLHREGTLWAWSPDEELASLYNRTIPERIPVETEKRWSRISRSSRVLLAIDEEGFLWERISKINEEEFLNPIRLQSIQGKYRWKSCMVIGGTRMGIREDGTCWAWGTRLDRIIGHHIASNSIPVQIGIRNDWINVVQRDYIPLIFAQDGSCWTVGPLALNEFQLKSSNQVVRVGVSGKVDHLVLAWGWPHGECFSIRRDGTLWRGRIAGYDKEKNEIIVAGERKISSRKDWVALDIGFAMTADGNIWQWFLTEEPHNSQFIPDRFRLKVVGSCVDLVE